MQQKTRINWGKDPESFGPFHLFREGKVIRVIKKYVKSGKVLDVGFGTGSLLFEMSKIGLSVEGVEPTKGFVDYVKNKINTAGSRDSINVKQGSATKLDYTDNYFDALVCTEVLEHVKQDKKAIKEFHRVLKKGGICVVSVPIYKKNWSLSDEYAGHFRRYEPKEILAMFRARGFEILTHKKILFSLTKFYHFKLKIPFYLKTKPKPNPKPNQTQAKLKPKLKQGVLKFVYFIISKIFLLDDLFESKYPLCIIFVARKKEK